MVTGQPKKRLNNAKTREKYITNKRKVRDQPDTNHGERKSKLLFQMKHKTNKRKERDRSVEKMSRKKAKKIDGVDVHTPTVKRRSKVKRKGCRK